MQLRDASLMQLMISVLRSYISVMLSTESTEEELQKDTLTDAMVLESGLDQLLNALQELLLITSKLSLHHLQEQWNLLRIEYSRHFNRTEARQVGINMLRIKKEKMEEKKHADIKQSKWGSLLTQKIRQEGGGWGSILQ